MQKRWEGRIWAAQHIVKECYACPGVAGEHQRNGMYSGKLGGLYEFPMPLELQYGEGTEPQVA